MVSQTSKSELKRRARGIEELVIELAALPPGEIAALPCDQELRDEIGASKRLKGGARKRQLKYATKLLRSRPVEELYSFLDRHKGSMLKEKRKFQQLEHFRNLLISEAIQFLEEQKSADDLINDNAPQEHFPGKETLQTIVRQLPGIDETQLKNTAIQFAKTRNTKYSRELFRILKGAAEKAEFSQQQDEQHGI